MGLIPETQCLRCGSRYSSLKRTCPVCGAPRVNQPTRVPPTSATVTPHTAASSRNAVNIRWQFVFGGILLLAVILAVIVLVSTSNSTPKVNPGPASVPSSPGGSTVYTAADLPSPSPSPEPTPEASPTPPIESMAITFLNNNVGAELTISQEGALVIDLDVSTYPVTDEPVTWRSSNEKILTVDDRGNVTIVGANPNAWVHAVIIAECCGVEKYVVIYVPSYQAAFLTNNLYDPETYEADNAEWDTIIYATPAPRA